MSPLFLALAAFAVLALAGSLAWLARREDPFVARCAELGLSTRRASADLPAHGAGELDGARVFAGLCPERGGLQRDGERPLRVGRLAGERGERILLLLETGVRPGIHGGVDLVTGRGWGEDVAAVEALLTHEVRAAAAEVPQASIVPADKLGGLLDAALKGRWPEGWTGLAVRAFLPPDAGADALAETFGRMRAVRDALVAADGARSAL